MSYFCIINPEELEEIRVVGTMYLKSKLKALQFPEKAFIRDLLSNYTSIAVKIEVNEWENVLTKTV